MFYLTNPGRRTGKKKRKGGKKKKRSAAQIAATKKMLAANRRKKRKVKVKSKRKRKSNKSYTKGVSKMAKGKRRSGKRRKSRRSRSGSLTFRRVTGKVYRSNPGGLKGILGTAMQGVKDGATVLAGEAVAGFVASRLPATIPPVASKGVVALGVAVLGKRFLPSDTARMLTAGAVASALREPAKSLPVIGPALAGADDIFVGEYLDPGVGEMDASGEFIGEYAY